MLLRALLVAVLVGVGLIVVGAVPLLLVRRDLRHQEREKREMEEFWGRRAQAQKDRYTRPVRKDWS